MAYYKSEISYFYILCFAIQNNFLLVLSFACSLRWSATKQTDQLSNPVTLYIYVKGTDTKEMIIMKGGTIIYNWMKIHVDKF